MAILGRANRRHFLRHPLQLLLAILGVAMGVGMVVSIDLATTSAHRAFALSMRALTGQYTHQITGTAAPLPESLFTRLRVEDGLHDSAPTIEGYASVKGLTLRLVGFDPLAERDLHNRFVHAARGGDATRLLSEANAAMLSALSAQRLGVKPGDSVEALINGQPHTLDIVAYVEGDSTPDPALEGLLLMDIASAQEMLGRIGRLDRIDLVLGPDSAEEEKLRQHLPPGVELSAVGGRTDATLRMTQAFELNLRAMSWLALLVGAFLIYNTMAFSVLQRRELLASLRILGVTRGQLLREILAEAAALGLLGGVLGAGLGLLAAQTLLRIVTRTINDLYFVLTVTEFLPDPNVLLRGLALGVLVAMVAALGPALEAAWAPPVIARARSGLESAARRALPWAAALGLATMAAALGLLRGEGGGLGAAFAGVFLLLLGYGLLIPLLLSFLARSIARLLLNACLPRLAVRSVAASASRAGLAVAALCIALSVGIGIGTMVDSFRSTVAQWLEQILQADIYVTAPTDGVRHSPPVPADLEAKLAQIKGVESTGSSLRRQVASSAGDSELLALEPPHLDRPGFRFQNADSHALWRGFADMRGVFVSEPYARKHGLNVGDSLQLVGDNGAVSLPVVGVFFDYRSDQGLIVIHRHLYEQLWQGWQPTAIGVYLPADTPADAVRRDVERLLAGTGQALTATSNREIRNTSLATFERTFTVTQVLRLLAVGVALVGVLGALLAFQHERRRELAVLRATGMTPAQAGRLVLWQTGFMGLAAGLFSIPLGLALALALVRVVNVRSFGWSMDFSISPAPLLASVVLAVLAALLAGLYPARLAMREQPALALREE